MCPPVLPSTTTFYFLAYYNIHCRLLFFPETGARSQQAEAPRSESAQPQNDFPEPSSMRLRCGYATDSFSAEEYRQDANTVRWLQFSSGRETEASYTGHLYPRYFMWEVMSLIEIETKQRSAFLIFFASCSVLSCSDNLQYNDKEPMASHSHVQWWSDVVLSDNF